MIPQISPILTSDSKRFSTIAIKDEGLDELFQKVIVADDSLAFERIFNQTYRSLCVISSRIVHSLELAEEIVDDVFFGFWKNRKTINVTTSFSAYLFVSVRNRSLDCLRKMKNKQNDTTLDNIADLASNQTIAHENMAYDELAQRIDSAIQSLPPQCRLIFVMSRDQDLTYKEIAQQLGLSVKTIDTQMGRALKYLRSEIKISSL